MIDKEKIIKKHPSLCYSCEHNRRPASDQYIQQGFVACSQTNKTAGFTFLIQAGDIEIGRADMQSNVFTKRTHNIEWFQYLVKHVAKCERFKLIQ